MCCLRHSIVLISAAIIPCLGCKGASGPVMVLDVRELSFTRPPEEKADLLLAGTPYPVTVQAESKPEGLALNLMSHGEVLETERYGLAGNQFGLLDADEEHFNPMLPLIVVPFHMGDAWTWKGDLITGGYGKPATAKIATAPETLFFGGVPHQTARIAADISLVANPGKPALKRQLVFWFEPKVGIVKRQFGPADVRQPAP